MTSNSEATSDADLDPAEAEGLAAVALPGGVRVAVLGAPRDPDIVIRTSGLGVVPIHHRLDIQRSGRGHLARVSWRTDS